MSLRRATAAGLATAPDSALEPRVVGYPSAPWYRAIQ